jgi:hypothetical protein
LVTGTPKANAKLNLEVRVGTSSVGTAASAVQPSAARRTSTTPHPVGYSHPMHTTRRKIPTASAFLMAMLFLPTLQPQTTADPKTVPVIDGGIGPCSAEFTVNDATGAPVYAATIRVHIAYGFMNVRKLDLEVGTSASGKARFTGLPDRTKQGLFFRASEGNREGSAFDDPSKTCKTELTIALQQKPQ